MEESDGKQEAKKAKREKRLDNIVKYVIRYSGLIFLLMTIFLYLDMTAYEEHGKGFRSHILIIMLYDFLGKWAVTIIMLVITLALLRMSFKQYMHKKSGRVVDGKNPNGAPNIWC